MGNPGSKYAGTRHNVGFVVVSRIAERIGARAGSELCDAKVGSGTLSGEPVRLAMPQTMMNDSGRSVACLAKRWRIEAADILVVCDDVSLPLGVIRMRAKGSDGGHNGLTSVISVLQTPEIPRLRVGILGEQAAGKDLTPFVLGQFTQTEKKLLQQAVESAVEACMVWAERGTAAAMNQFNKRLPPSGNAH